MTEKAGEDAAGIELALTIWDGCGDHWRARVVLADATELRFRSPYDLARFLTRPVVPSITAQGLR